MEIYIHIPFCIQKCLYCDFSSFPVHLHSIPEYIGVLLQQAEVRHFDFKTESVESIYIGGGTPSLLKPEQLFGLMNRIRSLFKVTPEAEISIECNPGTVNKTFIDYALEAGINRFSIGMQSADDELLAKIGRIHNFDEVLHTVQILKERKIHNYNLDLMFGLPGQTLAKWIKSVKTALSLQPAHLSLYGLIPEEGTPIKTDIDSGKLLLPDVEEQRSMYYEARKLLSSKGFKQYQISNFALPGYECRHNLGYWKQIPYIGLGLSASSMSAPKKTQSGICYKRTVNPSSFKQYENSVMNRSLTSEHENINEKEAAFETIMLRLRTMEGINDFEYKAMHGFLFSEKYSKLLIRLKEQGLMTQEGCFYRLTERGMDIQNSILLDFMD